ncbi:SDR family oxidoreductase [Roseovarius nubinhibens]|jgi:NAD(P)-dependent dehydrogenase (short-subunit alcohol dehydrogenase family)|uniref:Ketoreductase domain-containing protein n=1 Tax=Roseovarius nubinhibens (strain ATCC BAA-591 / DSM 15170 / ISM) TaxID=89187 RepID=A3SL40_ROSNI|nr:SDR family oxidoreductase [Roseovarius nubinhibens]EAP78071.1 hypothetical protein ISM_07240 [Roseovarius nubinhibens ISM]MBU2998900.1 SDR family oxidoreductase [Roseovarius nubinhibens]
MSETVLVTGGPSGIGRAISERCLARGWTVIAADVSEQVLAEFQSEMSGFGDRLICRQLDVSDEAAVNALVDGLEAEGHEITGLVNSAGIGTDIPATETSVELFRKVLDVNLIGSFMVARAVARHMIPRGRGSIVNISSISGMTGNKGRVAYGSSKAGVLQMTRVLSTEWAPHGLRVNAVSPGPVETPLVERMHETSSRKLWTDRLPMHRYASPSELSGGVVFLLDGDMSSFVTGQNIAIDGGFTTSGILNPQPAE